MQFDFKAMKPMGRYELLLGTVLPRPITIVTTLGAGGALNAAPYSLFNVVGHDPPVIMIAVLAHPEGRLKDTAANILATKEFVVNLVPRAMAEAMNITNIDAPPGRDELELAGLATAPSSGVAPPRIAASPVAFECRLLNSLSFGPHQAVIFGEVSYAHVADEFVRGRCATARPVRRHACGTLYSTTNERFEMVRPTWAQWQKEGKVS